eukprot:6181625-Pleurochrysis_carterae.AAC.1
MAADRQQHRIRPKRGGEHLGAFDGTKLRSELNGICRGRPELLRYAPPRPSNGQQWASDSMPLQRSTQAEPEPPSRAECDQRTRGRAGAHAGPEP